MRWDLSPFYGGTNDKMLDDDIARYALKAQEFRDAFKGRLSDQLGAAVAAYADLATLSNRIGGYLFLLSSVNVGDASVNAKKADAQQKMRSADGEYLTFFELEIVGLKDEAIASQAEVDAVVRKHLPYLEQVRRFASHFLSEEVESALTKRGMFGPSSWTEFFDEVEDDLRFTFEGNSVTMKDAMHVMNNDPSSERRASALAAIDHGLAGRFEKYSAQSLWMVAGAKSVEDRERGYAHPMSARNLSNRISDDVVEALHVAVTEAASPLAKRHYRLKAKLLGMPILRWSDRNAPLPFSDSSVYPYEEAVRTVLAAYQTFSPTLASLVRSVVDSRRIDAPAVPKKSAGAYNLSLVLPDGKPISYVLLNYLGAGRDVMTIAHELGHAVHGLLAGEAQGALMQQAPTAYAETASVFGEMTTFNDLRSRLESRGDRKAALALLHDKIDDVLNTAVRQIGFSNFERRLHGAQKKHSAQELSSSWLGTLHDLYGEDGDVFTYEHVDRLWSYISHFHRPFYVYGYSFGELLTQSLYAARPRIGAAFEPLYLDMLRSGGTKDAVSLLAPFGLNPNNTAFWTDGIDASLAVMVAEEERLAKELGLA